MLGTRRDFSHAISHLAANRGTQRELGGRRSVARSFERIPLQEDNIRSRLIPVNPRRQDSESGFALAGSVKTPAASFPRRDDRTLSVAPSGSRELSRNASSSARDWTTVETRSGIVGIVPYRMIRPRGTVV